MTFRKFIETERVNNRATINLSQIEKSDTV